MRSQIEMPPGFRFHPTDDELVNHYLIRKCSAQSIDVPIIADIDLYKFDPWQLPEMALYGEKEWYFFSPRDRKYPNGSRPNRSAGTGYWKATGADKPIGRPKTLGIKKALVFYAGKASKGVKTNWIMHEYRLADVDRSAGTGKKKNLRLDDWVLCRIYNKKGRIEKYLEESRDSESKPDDHTSLPGRNMKTEPFDLSSSDSFPKMQTDSSSCSEHVLSPEVQSEPQFQWHQVMDEAAFDFQFDSLDKLLEDAMLMEPQIYQFPTQQSQASPWQDMFLPTSAELKTFY